MTDKANTELFRLTKARSGTPGNRIFVSECERVLEPGSKLSYRSSNLLRDVPSLYIEFDI